MLDKNMYLKQYFISDYSLNMEKDHDPPHKTQQSVSMEEPNEEDGRTDGIIFFL